MDYKLDHTGDNGFVSEANKRYTYEDYAAWDDDVRYELIDGVAYMLAAPVWEHQSLGGEIFKQLAVFLTGKTCKAFYAPFDVRLNADQGDDTVVQPDVVVICDRSKLSKTGCIGAPDLVIEILSPSTSSRDKVLKFKKYLQAGVREYWIVDPDSKTVSVNVLDNRGYIAYAYAEDDKIFVHVLEGCVIDLKSVFTL